MTVTTGIKAYQDHLKALSGEKLDARSDTQDTGFKSLLTKSEPTSATSNLLGNAVGSAIDAMHKAETQTKLAVEGKADPLEVAHSVNAASLAAEQMTTTISKAINAYEGLLRMPI